MRLLCPSLAPLLGSLLLLLGRAGQAYGQAAPPADTTHRQPYRYVETMPVFPAQERSDSARTPMQRVMHFLNKDLHFPAKALRDGVQGKVFFSFTVDAGGRAGNIKLVQGLREDVDAEVLRVAHRLDSIRWRPGTQNGRPVQVAFTVPITFSVQGGPVRPGVQGADSLDLPRFHRARLPVSLWGLRHPVPTRQGLIYGACLPRAGGSDALGHYVRVVNLTTGEAFRLPVKPALHLQRADAFYYALPPGRYALSEYEFGPPAERLARRPARPGSAVAATRYVFEVTAGQLHYVGTWNLANANEALFLDEKDLLDAVLQPQSAALHFEAARRAIPH